MNELLKAMREVVTSLSKERGYCNCDPKVNVFLMLVSASLLSSSSGALLPLLAMLLSITIALKNKVSLQDMKSIAIIFLFTCVIVLPIALSDPKEAIDFTLKVTATSLLVLVSVLSIGWGKIAEALEGIILPEGMGIVMRLLLINVSILLKDLMDLLTARKARTLGKCGLSCEWKLRATALAALLEKAAHRSSRVEMALRSRTFGTSYRSYKIISFETMVYILIIIVWVIEVVGVQRYLVQIR